jgi:enoyl-CoA hydratase/carnithine racemase
MVRTIRLILSVMAIAVAAALTGQAFSARSALAGGVVSCLPPTATDTPQPLGFIQPQQPSFGIAQADPTATCTVPPIVRTSTPTPTKTSAATNTPVPPTAAPATNTPVPPQPTATQPGGGVGGQGVQPPNTGSGPDARSVNWLALGGGLILLLAGGTSLASAARRRR